MAPSFKSHRHFHFTRASSFLRSYRSNAQSAAHPFLHAVVLLRCSLGLFAHGGTSQCELAVSPLRKARFTTHIPSNQHYHPGMRALYVLMHLASAYIPVSASLCQMPPVLDASVHVWACTLSGISEGWMHLNYGCKLRSLMSPSLHEGKSLQTRPPEFKSQPACSVVGCSVP